MARKTEVESKPEQVEQPKRGRRRNNENESNSASNVSTAGSVSSKPTGGSRKRNATAGTAGTVSSSSATAGTVGSSTVSRRAVHTFESVKVEFDALKARLDQAIEDLKQGKTTAQVKFLKSVRKDLNTIDEHTARISKKRVTNRKVNPNSGFGKPVRISSQLAKFTGWDPSATYSRTSVTNFLVDYVRKHNLQDPNNGKNIVPDDGLRKLFDYDASKHKPLSYAQMQYHLKRCNHYPKESPSREATSSRDAQGSRTLPVVQEESQSPSTASKKSKKNKAVPSA